jgi:DnaJ-class molecular chaperone
MNIFDDVKAVICKACLGAKAVDGKPCTACDGKGFIKVPIVRWFRKLFIL